MTIISTLKTGYQEKIQSYKQLFNQTLYATMNGGAKNGLEKAKEVNN